MTITIKKSDMQNRCVINVSGRSLRAYLLKRGDRLPDVKTSVYILFDERRTCFYVGETDNKPTGGFDARFKQHESTRTEHWFSRAICFADDRFAYSEVRKWIEWKLYSLAKEGRYVLTSTATGKYSELEAPSGGRELFEEVVELLDLLGVPWASMQTKNDRADGSGMGVVPPQAFKSPTQLAKAIAMKYNGGRAADYAIQLLNRKAAVKHGKWRDILERVGLAFDETGLIVNWKTARV